MLVTALAASPPAIDENFESRLNGPDQGTINAWLVGLRKRTEDPALASQAEAGELPPLVFRGGVAKKIKTQNKIGSLLYVAALQGLRGEDLYLDTDREITLTCSRTGVPVLFTLDMTKLFSTASEAENE